MAPELVARISVVSRRTAKRSTQECAGAKEGAAKIRDSLARGPYALTEDGYRSKFNEGGKKMVHAYNEMRETGETVSPPYGFTAYRFQGRQQTTCLWN